MKYFLSVAGFLVILHSDARATSPCSPDSWFSNPKRTASEWEAQPTVKIILVGKLKLRKENLIPFANCAEKDRSKCAVDDYSEVSVEVSKIEKGGPVRFAVMNLNKSYCAQSPPKAIGEMFRFYAYADDLKPNSADNKFSYVYYEQLQNKK